MNKTMSVKLTRLTALMVTLVLTFAALTAVSGSASAVYVFNPNTFTHSDPINNYDNFTGIISDPTFGPCVYMNTHTIYFDSRYGAYTRGSTDVHRYIGERQDLSNGATTIPTTVLSFFADSGVEIKIYDNSRDLIACSISNPSGDTDEVLRYKKTTYPASNKAFYYYELAPRSALQSNFYVEIYTLTSNTLHYSVWFGVPLFSESSMTMSVPLRSITNPTTTSGAVTTSSSPQVPVRSWVKSVRYSISSEMNRYYVSQLYDGIRFPGRTTYTRFLSGNTNSPLFNTSNATEARGTYYHRFDGISWAYGANGVTYMNMANCVVNYYYIFGE